MNPFENSTTPHQSGHAQVWDKLCKSLCEYQDEDPPAESLIYYLLLSKIKTPLNSNSPSGQDNPVIKILKAVLEGHGLLQESSVEACLDTVSEEEILTLCKHVLAKHGVECVNFVNQEDDCDPLILAINNHYGKVTNWLLEQGANPSSDYRIDGFYDEEGQKAYVSSFLVAANKGQIDTALSLLQECREAPIGNEVFTNYLLQLFNYADSPHLLYILRHPEQLDLLHPDYRNVKKLYEGFIHLVAQLLLYGAEIKIEFDEMLYQKPYSLEVFLAAFVQAIDKLYFSELHNSKQLKKQHPGQVFFFIPKAPFNYSGNEKVKKLIAQFLSVAFHTHVTHLRKMKQGDQHFERLLLNVCYSSLSELTRAAWQQAEEQYQHNQDSTPYELAKKFSDDIENPYKAMAAINWMEPTHPAWSYVLTKAIQYAPEELLCTSDKLGQWLLANEQAENSNVRFLQELAKSIADKLLIGDCDETILDRNSFLLLAFLGSTEKLFQTIDLRIKVMEEIFKRVEENVRENRIIASEYTEILAVADDTERHKRIISCFSELSLKCYGRELITWRVKHIVNMIAISKKWLTKLNLGFYPAKQALLFLKEIKTLRPGDAASIQSMAFPDLGPSLKEALEHLPGFTSLTSLALTISEFTEENVACLRSSEFAVPASLQGIQINQIPIHISELEAYLSEQLLFQANPSKKPRLS